MLTKNKVGALLSRPYSDKLLLILFILVPFGVLSFGSIHKGHVIAFAIGIVLIVSCTIREKPLAWFMVYVAGWVLWRHANFVYQITPFLVEPKLTMLAMMALICGTVIYLRVIKSKISNEWFYNMICVSVMIQALLALCQTMGFTPAYDLVSSRINTRWDMKPTEATAMLGNSNYLAAYVAISLPFFFRKHWAWCLILLLPLLLYIKVSAAIITALAVFAVYFSKDLKQFAIITAVCISVAAAYLIFVEKLKMNNPRFDMWVMALDSFKTWPQIIFGFGPGFRHSGEVLHNEWLALFRTFGLIGLILIATYFWQTIRKAGDRKILAGIVAIAVNWLGNPGMQTAPAIFLTLIIFGLAQREVVNG